MPQAQYNNEGPRSPDAQRRIPLAPMNQVVMLSGYVNPAQTYIADCRPDEPSILFRLSARRRMGYRHLTEHADQLVREQERQRDYISHRPECQLSDQDWPAAHEVSGAKTIYASPS